MPTVKCIFIRRPCRISIQQARGKVFNAINAPCAYDIRGSILVCERKIDKVQIGKAIAFGLSRTTSRVINSIEISVPVEDNVMDTLTC